MRSNNWLIIVALLAENLVIAQPAPMKPSVMDSLQESLQSNANDTIKVHAYYWLSRANTLSNTTKSIEFANEGLELAEKAKFRMGEIKCLEALSFSYAITSSFEKGFKQPINKWN